MQKKVSPIPPGYHTITPYLIIKGASSALEFYKKAFNAKELIRIMTAEQKVAHAEIQIGDSRIMLADEFSEMGTVASPRTSGWTSFFLHVYIEDVDSFTRQAEAAGAVVIRPVADQIYGDRASLIEDPFGHLWSLATHIKDVTQQELQQKMQEQKK